MTIARFTPLTDFVSLREAMERLQFTVPVDLWETPDAYHLRADMPDERWLRQERRAGKFQRSFALPKAESLKPRTIKINAADQK